MLKIDFFDSRYPYVYRIPRIKNIQPTMSNCLVCNTSSDLTSPIVCRTCWKTCDGHAKAPVKSNVVDSSAEVSKLQNQLNVANTNVAAKNVQIAALNKQIASQSSTVSGIPTFVHQIAHSITHPMNNTSKVSISLMSVVGVFVCYFWVFSPRVLGIMLMAIIVGVAWCIDRKPASKAPDAKAPAAKAPAAKAPAAKAPAKTASSNTSIERMTSRKIQPPSANTMTRRPGGYVCKGCRRPNDGSLTETNVFCNVCRREHQSPFNDHQSQDFYRRNGGSRGGYPTDPVYRAEPVEDFRRNYRPPVQETQWYPQEELNEFTQGRPPAN